MIYDLGCMKSGRNFSFTILELLIGIALVGVISVVAILLINPKTQMEKVWDGQRKQDLSTLKKVFENYYNDEEKYPDPDEICYDEPQEDGETGYCFCHVCGVAKNNFITYLPRLQCDPRYPVKKYLYHYSCVEAPRVQKYQLCAQLSYEPFIPGIIPKYYNYGVSSPNIDINTCMSVNDPSMPRVPLENLPCPPDPQEKFCLKSGCNICGTFAECNVPGSCDGKDRYYDYSCEIKCR